MSTPFQNRLVGTIIVAAVAIIILPDLLDGNKKTYQDEFEKIPPPPKVDFVKTSRVFPQEKIATISDEKLSEEPAIDDSLSLTKAKSKADEASKDSKVIVKAAHDESSVAVQKFSAPEKSILKQAWVVQLGSFRHKKNVAQLLIKLKNNGYTAFTKPIKTKSGTLIKVFIGPELIKSSLEKKIPALKKLTGVKGKVARFYPAK